MRLKTMLMIFICFFMIGMNYSLGAVHSQAERLDDIAGGGGAAAETTNGNCVACSGNNETMTEIKIDGYIRGYYCSKCHLVSKYINQSNSWKLAVCFTCGTDNKIPIQRISAGKYKCTKEEIEIAFDKEYLRWAHVKCNTCTQLGHNICEIEKYEGSNAYMCECAYVGGGVKYAIEKSGNKYIHVKCDECSAPTMIYNGSAKKIKCINCQTESGGPTTGKLSSESFFSAGKTQFESKIQSEIDGNLDPLKYIQSIIMLIGSLGAIIIILIYGIQWAMAPAAKRQELKASLVPLSLGVILLVIGPRLVVPLYEMFTNNNQSDYMTDAAHAESIAGNIISVVQAIGYIVAIVMVLYIGIQWAMATPNKRQELKSRMINLAIGAILIVGGVTILDWIVDIANKDLNVKTSSISVIADAQTDVKLL